MSERLNGTLLRGYRKEVRIILRGDYPNPSKELTDAVRREATNRTEAHMQNLEVELENIRNSNV